MCNITRNLTIEEGGASLSVNSTKEGTIRLSVRRGFQSGTTILPKDVTKVLYDFLGSVLKENTGSPEFALETLRKEVI